MRDDVVVLPEPALEFRYEQQLVDPHDGLAVFGPYDGNQPSHPRGISYAVVGTPAGVASFRAWSRLIQGPILPEGDLDPRLWPPYPGFDAAFACSWPAEASREIVLDEQDLRDDARLQDPSKRAASVVERYLGAIRRIQQRDDPVHVVVCVVPDLVWVNCRTQSHVREPIGARISRTERQSRRSGQVDLFDRFDPEIYRYSVDFRRQIKARLMQYDLPIQIVRESTLRLSPATFGERTLTPLCDRAWNLSVALYYKSGGKPWRLSSARPGVCYIGIAFRQSDPSSHSPTACCAAQMFLDSGDGVVFMGKFGPWYSPDRHAFHLSRDAAQHLLGGVLRTYADLEGQPLREIFLHSRSDISREEWEGYRAACPAGVQLVGIRVRQERGDVRLFREGTRPVLRGTFWPVGSRLGYLWGAGFKPHLGTYDCWETPAPLRIQVQHGDAEITQVATDILGLTKLNYNACGIGDAEPVTIKFSDAVGEILISNPTVTDRRPNFRFYI